MSFCNASVLSHRAQWHTLLIAVMARNEYCFQLHFGSIRRTLYCALSQVLSNGVEIVLLKALSFFSVVWFPLHQILESLSDVRMTEKYRPTYIRALGLHIKERLGPLAEFV